MAQIKASDFREEHLKLGDVWTWSNQLHESEDFLVTVPLTEDALAEVDSLLVRASFETAQGDALEGLVVYAMGRGNVFAIEIFEGDQKFTFNRFAREPSLAELRRLAAHLNKDADKLLPITYKVVSQKLAIPSDSFAF
ncbi:hypothetical protein ACKI2N_031965 [Cupriavidus sp. 30B13]|uniref:hypothetical protein n=1 Tax=Cupriavidus sp. 30B13 TaxID=3384241 RepID=UPI003B8F585D